MNGRRRPGAMWQERVPRTAVRLRLPDASPDESLVYALAMIVGALFGYLAALG